jgi:hypothetical protein
MSYTFISAARYLIFSFPIILLFSLLASASFPQSVSASYFVREGISPSANHTAQEDDEGRTPRRKYALIAIVVLVIVTTILHASDRLTVFCDYTDVAMTTASIVIPFVIRLIAGFLEFSATAANWFMLLVFVLLFGLVARSTWIHNRNVLFSLMALITKYSVVAGYLVVMVGTIFDGGPKQKHETQEEYEFRVKRTEEYNAALRIAATAFFLFFTHLITRDRCFSTLADYLQLDKKTDGDTQNCPFELLQDLSQKRI